MAGLTSWLSVDDTAPPGAVGTTSWLNIEDEAAPPPPPPPPSAVGRTSWVQIEDAAPPPGSVARTSWVQIEDATSPAPSGTATVTVSGQAVTVSVTGANISGATASLAPGSPANGAVAQSAIALTVTGSTSATGTFTAVPAGSYVGAVTLTGPGGATGITGLAFDIIGIDGEATAPGAGTPGAAPTITAQPAAQSVIAGATATFSSAATGSPTPTAQWQRSNNSGSSWANISGATLGAYSLTTAIGDNGAQFRCVWSNGAGSSATSSPAVLTVNAAVIAPQISAAPQPQTAVDGQAAAFAVNATGTAPLAYQWRRNGVNIAGATSASYAFVATLADNNAQYSVIVSNSGGSVTSSAALLTVTQSGSAPPPAPPTTGPTRSYLDLASSIAMELPDCPVFTIAEGLQEAAIKLYTDVRAWRLRDVEVATTVAGQAYYTAAGIPVDAVLVGVPGLWVGPRQVNEYRRDMRVQPDLTSTRYHASVVGNDTIELIPAPQNGGDVIRGEIAIAPSQSASGIPETLWQKHSEGIKAYACAKLMGMLGKPWSNPGMAAEHRRKWHALSLRYSTELGPLSREPLLRVRPSPI